jgi:hypothetical protein
MGRERRGVILPMTLVTAVLIAITYGVSVWSGSGFWDAFYPQFLATVFGVAFTIMLTYAVWLQQQKGKRAHQRQQLLKDLKFEVKENLKRLANMETSLNETVESSESPLRIQKLRTIVMEYALKPENLVLLENFDLEDNIDWAYEQCGEFNHRFKECFIQYLAQLGTRQLPAQQNGVRRARIGLWAEISPEINFTCTVLRRLEEQLEACVEPATP